MKTDFDMVRDFHLAFNQPVRTEPYIPAEHEVKLRLDLIDEERTELDEALAREDIVAIADALGDMLYVIHGMGHTFGIDLDRVFREIHRANMTKLGDDGKPIKRADGKVLKNPKWSPPDHSFLLPNIGDLARGALSEQA